ncbi:MAG: type II toxin-antitoxin system RelE/ParE family toxin [Bacteroidetes bacterium]|nr:type II toxin-antitoxin system RelE/ParE family toxin [Bacteroidota bacterium]
MAWTIEYSDEAIKNLKKLDKQTVRKISDYLKGRVANAEDPTRFGKPLTGNLAGKHRYRVGDYRIICRIEQKVIRVSVLRIGHRSRVYEKDLA